MAWPSAESGTAVIAKDALKLKHARGRDALWWVMTGFRSGFRPITKTALMNRRQRTAFENSPEKIEKKR